MKKLFYIMMAVASGLVSQPANALLLCNCPQIGTTHSKLFWKQLNVWGRPVVLQCLETSRCEAIACTHRTYPDPDNPFEYEGAEQVIFVTCNREIVSEYLNSTVDQPEAEETSPELETMPR